MIEKNPNGRDVMVQITAPEEIASIEDNGFMDIFGGKDEHGQYWALDFSLEDWRDRKGPTRARPE